MVVMPGSYILQWKYFDSAKSSFQALSMHKSKVMYYVEVIQSEQFRYVSLLEAGHSYR